MPKYSIIELRKDLYYIYEDGEIVFKTNSKEYAVEKVNQLEFIDLLKETMTYQ